MKKYTLFSLFLFLFPGQSYSADVGSNPVEKFNRFVEPFLPVLNDLYHPRFLEDDPYTRYLSNPDLGAKNALKTGNKKASDELFAELQKLVSAMDQDRFMGQVNNLLQEFKITWEEVDDALENLIKRKQSLTGKEKKAIASKEDDERDKLRLPLYRIATKLCLLIIGRVWGILKEEHGDIFTGQKSLKNYIVENQSHFRDMWRFIYLNPLFGYNIAELFIMIIAKANQTISKPRSSYSTPWSIYSSDSDSDSDSSDSDSDYDY